MTLFHENFKNKKPYVTITLNKDLQLHLCEQDLNIPEGCQITSFVAKNC